MLNKLTSLDVIGIWGTGKVGRSAAHFLNTYYKNIKIIFFDEKKVKSCDLEFELLKFELLKFELIEELENIDLFFSKINYLIPSPGIPKYKYISRNIKIISELDIFSDFYKNNSIAITGTVGKTTTVLLLDHCLKLANINSIALGNIGEPLLLWKPEKDSLPILELSSFQLENSNYYAPQISVIINLYNNHLDHHLDFNNYKKAKLNVLKNQKDGLIITHNSLVQEIRAINKKIPVIYTDFVPDLYPNESYILQESNQDLVLINLNGKHKIGNYQEFNNLQQRLAKDTVLIVLAIFNFLKIKFDYKYLTSFVLPSHRAETIAIKNNVEYIDDSKSTIIEATLHALKMQNKPTILLLGGVSKGVDRQNIFKELVFLNQLKFIIFFGKEAEMLSEQAFSYFKNIASCKNLEEAVILAKKIALSGEVVLFSPSGASFDLFNNYQERGQRFKELVNLW